ncbi:MAG: PAS domain S-box protein [Bacteroidota bacterium]
MIKNISDAVVVTDAEQIDAAGPKILFVNEAFTRMTGYEALEVIGQSLGILQGKNTSQTEVDKLKTSLKAWQPFRVEFINYKKNGAEFTVENEFVPLANEAGLFTHWVSVQRDITQRRLEEKLLRESENFNRTVLESSPDCLKVLDSEGRLQFMNFNGLCQMEIDDFGQFKNKFWWNLWGKENEELVRSSVDKALTGEVTHFSAFCSTAKGTPKWWDVTISPVGNKTDGFYQLLSVSRDITEQRNAEEKIRQLNISLEEKVSSRTSELNQKNAELEQLNRELTSFNYIASHDLQEPLRKIQLFGNMLKEAEISADKRSIYTNKIIAASARMSSLIHSLRAFSLTQITDLSREECNLNTIVSETMAALQEEIESSSVAFETDTLPTVHGIRFLYSQLFINLVENAIKYSRLDVQPLVKITCETVHSDLVNSPLKQTDKQYYKISVADNGIGFNNSFKQQIFAPFQRLHGHGVYAGTGMGLAICQKIVQRHDGWLEADSKEGVGSVFTIYLPFAYE